MSKVIIGKCDMCGIDMIVGTPIEDKVVCHNCYVKYEKDKISFLQELTNKQKQQISDLQSQLTEKDKEIEELKQRLKDTIKIYSDDFVEKDKELKELRFRARNIFPLVENLEDKVNQDKISFAVDILEEIADCSNYINSKLDFECGSYVPENVIRDKIKYLKGNKYE